MSNMDFKYYRDVLNNAIFTDEKCEICGGEEFCLDGVYFEYNQDISSVCLKCLRAVSYTHLKKVSSATIQVMFDDVQPEPSEDFVEYKKNDGDWIVSAYSPKSTNKYQVTLEVEGNPEYPAVRVQEFEEIINNIDQMCIRDRYSILP